MLELYTAEPNTFFLKPLIALNEKSVSFTAHWFEPTRFEQFAPGFPVDTEAKLHLEREGPVLAHDGTLITSSYFMLEYIAETFPGEPLLPQAPIDQYHARASGQFLGAHLGSLVPVLGCAKYLAPALATRESSELSAAIARIEPSERRMGWKNVLDGAYTPQILTTARERLKFPVGRVEATLANGPWLAGPRYSIADIDAFAMLRVLPDLAPEVVNPVSTPRTMDFIARMNERPAVRAALATSKSGKPQEHFVPGVEPSRWG
jgi:GSH-dependent disulfide-bond oxidoreductase